MAPSALSPATGSHEQQSITNGRPHHKDGNAARSANTEVKSPSDDATEAFETIQHTFESALAAITTLPEENRTLKAELIELKAKLANLEAEKGKADKIAAKALDDLATERKKHAKQTEKLQVLAKKFTTQYETFKAGHRKEDEDLVAVPREANINKENDKSILEIKSLQEKLRTERKTHAEEKEEWKEENHDFLGRIQDLETELSSLQFEHGHTLGAADSRNAELFLLNSELKLELKKLKSQRKTKKEPPINIEGYESASEIYDRDYQQLEKQHDSLHEELAEVKEDLMKARREMEKIKPLMKNAADVRLRFLAKAKEDVLDSPAEDRDVLVIKAGNAAAHQADGAMDAIILTTGLVENPEIWSKIFEELYGTNPRDYRRLSPIARRIKDCEATLRTHRPLKDGKGPRDLREEAERHLSTLKGLSAGGVFEAEKSFEVESIVEHLERVTEKLLDEEF